MSKLKTLKDLEQNTQISHRFRYVCVDDLRQEAIKWVKRIYDGDGCEKCPVECLMRDGCPAGDLHGCGACHIMKLFFNITEEDLK
ncbi:MAG: hypothetical protein QQN41_11335 [Nitrosopumilus sp.]